LKKVDRKKVESERIERTTQNMNASTIGKRSSKIDAGTKV
jgi:hypothetical protein